MKKIILIGLCMLLISGCNGKELMKTLQEEDTKLDAQYERMQEKWNLREITDLDCVFDNCMIECDTNLTINRMDYDYNGDENIDDFEYEVMKSASDRKSECFNDCLEYNWEYMDECRNMA